MTNSERRVGLVRRALDAAGRRAARLGDLRARRPRARPRATRSPGRRRRRCTTSTSRTTAGRLCDQTGLIARAAATRGAAAVARARARADGDGRTRAPSGSTRAGASRPPSGRARLAPTPHAEPADAPRRRVPARADHRPRRAPVAHDDPHRQVEGRCSAAEPEPFVELHPDDAPARRRRATASACACARAAGARRCARGSPTRVPEGVAFAPFHWGALHLEPGARRRSTGSVARRSTRLAARRS